MIYEVQDQIPMKVSIYLKNEYFHDQLYEAMPKEWRSNELSTLAYMKNEKGYFAENIVYIEILN